MKFLMFADPLEFAIDKAIAVPVKEFYIQNKSGYLMAIWGIKKLFFQMFSSLSNTSLTEASKSNADR